MPSRFAWRAGATALLLAMVGAAGAIAVPRVLRSRAISEASKRGITLTVGSARLAWLAVELADVGLELEGVPGLDARFVTLRLNVDGRLHPSGIVGRGGRVAITDADSVRERIGRWRERRGAAVAPSGGRQ